MPGDWEVEARLKQVVESAPLVLWAVDLQGVFRLSEGRALLGLGLRPGQAVGQSAFEMYKDFPAIIEAIKRCLGGEDLTYAVDVGGRYFETHLSPMRDQRGALVGGLGVSLDVTDRKRAEAERERLQVQLLHVQKLESLGLLAGGIAHDFNNLLTAILGGASIALATLPEGSPARRDIDNVILAARRASDLARQMLAYSGKGHFEVEPIDLSAHLRETAALLETTISKKVQLRLQLGVRLPAIEADSAQLQQVLMNLVINATEAIGDERGTVLVTTGTQEVDEAYARTVFPNDALAPGRYVHLEVHDTGCGMSAETQAKIFDPFFSTKFTGRGLGLAAVLGIVRAHHGAIKVDSSPGKGTTFKMFFPISEAVPVARETPAAGYQGQGLILLVDDDALVRRIARRILEMAGFSVVEAVDGREGVALFDQHAAELVLVLLDMTMPQMNGEETFRELRLRRTEVPVILTSGYNEVEATRSFTAKGLAGFLQKPFTPADMLAAVAKVLGRSRPPAP